MIFHSYHAVTRCLGTSCCNNECHSSNGAVCVARNSLEIANNKYCSSHSHSLTEDSKVSPNNIFLIIGLLIPQIGDGKLPVEQLCLEPQRIPTCTLVWWVITGPHAKNLVCNQITIKGVKILIILALVVISFISVIMFICVSIFRIAFAPHTHNAIVLPVTFPPWCFLALDLHFSHHALIIWM